LNRWIEPALLDVLETAGVGCIAFSPLAQGVLTSRYLDGVPAGSRASRGGSLRAAAISPERLSMVRKLNDLAQRRGQTLAQMAIAWVLRDPRMTSAVIGASSVEQLEENVAAIHHPPFQPSELEEIDALCSSAP
jgi:L-glyceraldehyde 3-phosphate reductase